MVRAARSAIRSGSVAWIEAYVVGLRPEERSESAEESEISVRRTSADLKA